MFILFLKRTTQNIFIYSLLIMPVPRASHDLMQHVKVQLRSNKQCVPHINSPRIVILAAHINSFIHVAVGRGVLTRALHGDAVCLGTVSKLLCASFPRTAGASDSHSRPRPALGTPTERRKHAPSQRTEVSNFIPLIIDSARFSAPEGPRSVRNTLRTKGDGVQCLAAVYRLQVKGFWQGSHEDVKPSVVAKMVHQGNGEQNDCNIIAKIRFSAF